MALPPLPAKDRRGTRLSTIEAADAPEARSREGFWLSRATGPGWVWLNSATLAAASANAAFNTAAGTLSAAVAANATSISSSITIPVGTRIVLGGGTANVEEVIVNGTATGAGPYAVPITAAAKTHASGDAVNILAPAAGGGSFRLGITPVMADCKIVAANLALYNLFGGLSTDAVNFWTATVQWQVGNGAAQAVVAKGTGNQVWGRRTVINFDPHAFSNQIVPKGASIEFAFAPTAAPAAIVDPLVAVRLEELT